MEVPSSTSPVFSNLPPHSLVVVGTQNSLKINAVASCVAPTVQVVGFAEAFESSVSEWPIGREETTQGAEFRARTAVKRNPKAIAGVGVESGFHPQASPQNPWVVFVVAVIIFATGERFVGVSYDLKCPITECQRTAQVIHSISQCSNSELQKETALQLKDKTQRE